MKVRDIMQTEVVTLRFDDALDIAGDIMALGRIRHLPVVDGDHRLLGLVTQRDLLKASVSSVLGLASRAQREWLQKIRVRDVMVSDVVAVTPDTPIREALDRMIEGKLGCLPAIHEGKLVGLITETDLLRSLRQAFEPRQ